MNNKPQCIAKLDRWRFAVLRPPKQWLDKPPSIPGFQIVKDSFVRQQTKVGTYGRVRSLENPKTGTKIFIQYQRKHGWLEHMLVTVVANDATGILLPEILAIERAFRQIKNRMVELAFDFSLRSGVDRQFVLKHGLFGKSRPANYPQFPDQLRYGTRHSAKFVRCYFKQETDAFRAELQVHSTWTGLPETGRLLHTLPLSSEDFRFVDVDWNAVDSYLQRKFSHGNRISEEARQRYGSIHQLLSFLTAEGVNNPHMFLRTSEKDELIRQAFNVWRQSVRPGGKK